jgi:hypothetical protein
MAEISFQPKSAPLTGARLPTIEDINALNHFSERTVWRPAQPAAKKIALGKVSFFLSFVAGVALCIVGEFLPSAYKNIRSDHKTPPLSTAANAYVVLKHPTEADFTRLNAAGCPSVTLLIPKDTILPSVYKDATFKIVPVDGSSIPSEGYLLNGYQWYPVGP